MSDRSMRTLRKTWDNRKEVPAAAQRARQQMWTARIRWYEGDVHPEIRLQLEVPDGSLNWYPEDRPNANAIWDAFKERPGKIFDNLRAQGTS